MECFVKLAISGNNDIDTIYDLTNVLSEYSSFNKKDILFALFENHIVYYIPINGHLTDEESSECVHKMSLLENVFDFDVEFSTGVPLMEQNQEQVDIQDQDLFSHTDYDIVEDLVVYMRNDFRFYRTYYYPTLHRISKELKHNKSLNVKKQFKPVIRTAIKEYCIKYNTPEESSELFGDDEWSMILDKIYQEEIDNIRNGDYL